MEQESKALSAYLAQAGVCSRRKATDLIKDGLVKVNGKVITKPFYRVLKKDEVVYTGKKIVQQKDVVYLVLNKPRACITTTTDEKGRPSVLDLLPSTFVRKRIYPVGRLDCNTTGLLVLTNDGEMAHRLMHPKYNIKKTYMVRVHRPIDSKDIARIKKGIRLADGIMRFDQIQCHTSSRETRALVTLHSGKKRIIRRVFEVLGYRVCRLDRVLYGPLSIKGLERGEWRYLTRKEIRKLRTSVNF